MRTLLSIVSLAVCLSVLAGCSANVGSQTFFDAASSSTARTAWLAARLARAIDRGSAAFGCVSCVACFRR
jgi:hypothetical protein